MNISIRFIFTKVIVILMTFLLGLPCAVKKDFKQVLNIAILDLEQNEKPNRAIVCEFFSKKGNYSIPVSFQKGIQKFNYHFGAVKYSSEASHFNSHPFADLQIVASVPIYILHEQYLI